MSKHQEWKMLHLLYTCARSRSPHGQRILTIQELIDAGVWCEPDTHQLLEDAGVVARVGDGYELSKPVRKILSTFTVAQGPESHTDIRVDYPEAFVVMAFSEIWSDSVFDQMLKPGIQGANFSVFKGDSIVRLGELSTNVWQSITSAGVVVAEVSVPNPNVYYEIGLADALGKPVFLFKQKGVKLPADFNGAHYYEYDTSDLGLEAGRQTLTDALKQWSDQRDHRPFGVKALVDR